MSLIVTRWFMGPSPRFPKRGWGGTASRSPGDAMNANWYSTWGRTGIAGASSEFVPMAWGSSSVTNEAIFNQLLGHSSELILGFNDPERAEQATMSVAKAIALWPKLMSSGLATRSRERLVCRGTATGASTSSMQPTS